MIEEVRFADDSPLEEGGFEPLVPLTLNATNAGTRRPETPGLVDRLLHVLKPPADEEGRRLL